MQPRILYPGRLSFSIEGEIKSFQDREKLKEYMSTKPALQKRKKNTKGESYNPRESPRITDQKETETIYINRLLQ